MALLYSRCSCCVRMACAGAVDSPTEGVGGTASGSFQVITANSHQHVRPLPLAVCCSPSSIPHPFFAGRVFREPREFLFRKRGHRLSNASWQFAGAFSLGLVGFGRCNTAHLCTCRVCDVTSADVTDCDREIWLSVCSEASGLVHKRTDVCQRWVVLMWIMDYVQSL